MSDTAAWLADCATRGVQVTAIGGAIDLRPRPRVTERDLWFARHYKAAVLEALMRPRAMTPRLAAAEPVERREAVAPDPTADVLGAGDGPPLRSPVYPSYGDVMGIPAISLRDKPGWDEFAWIQRVHAQDVARATPRAGGRARRAGEDDDAATGWDDTSIGRALRAAEDDD